jgi:hypothetical protein
MKTNVQPKVHPWGDTTVPSIYGQTVISGVTFGSYGYTGCVPADRNVAITGTGRNGENSDAWHPAVLSNIELVDVEEDSKVYIVPTDPEWINQGVGLAVLQIFLAALKSWYSQLIVLIWTVMDIG